jgi:hypothetical protein
MTRRAHSTCSPLATCLMLAIVESYAADYAGATSAAAAAAYPRPAYDLTEAPPLPMAEGGAAVATPTSVGQRGGGGGRGGGRGSGRGRPAVSFHGRYFDAPPSAVNPGALSAELRSLLGMREGDPPPYLQRMRMLGYPPGYLGGPNAAAHEDAPLEMHQQNGHADQRRCMDPDRDAVRQGGGGGGGGHALAQRQRATTVLPTVEFPGLNAPPPPGADLELLGWR